MYYLYASHINSQNQNITLIVCTPMQTAVPVTLPRMTGQNLIEHMTQLIGRSDFRIIFSNDSNREKYKKYELKGEDIIRNLLKEYNAFPSLAFNS